MNIIMRIDSLWVKMDGIAPFQYVEDVHRVSFCSEQIVDADDVDLLGKWEISNCGLRK